MISYKNIPELITWFRVLLIPLLLLVFFSNIEYANWISFSIFTIAGISDGIDGWLARKWEATSDFGAFLDPVADKLMVCSALIVIVMMYDTLFIALSSIILIGRELVISALREWHAKLSITETTSVSLWGKLKTFAQFFAIAFLLIGETVGFINTVLIGNILISVAIILSLWSMIQYLWKSYTQQNP